MELGNVDQLEIPNYTKNSSVILDYLEAMSSLRRKRPHHATLPQRNVTYRWRGSVERQFPKRRNNNRSYGIQDNNGAVNSPWITCQNGAKHKEYKI